MYVLNLDTLDQTDQPLAGHACSEKLHRRGIIKSVPGPPIIQYMHGIIKISVILSRA